MTVTDLDSTLDAIYAADLDAFTRERNEAAKRLKADGDAEAAATVKALRKPTVSAWAVNRLARTRRRRVDALLDAGHRLRDAQRTLLSGDGQTAFAEAAGRHGEALDGLVEDARELLEGARGGATDAVLDRVRDTLRTASVTDEGRELLARGRLAEDLAPAGFDALGPPVAAPREQRDADARRTRVRGLERDLRAARDAAKEARDAAAAAERAARDATKGAARLAAAADAARTRVERAEADVHAVDAELRAARSG